MGPGVLSGLLESLFCVRTGYEPTRCHGVIKAALVETAVRARAAARQRERLAQYQSPVPTTLTEREQGDSREVIGAAYGVSGGTAAALMG
jgi:hypothetical protein